MAKKIGIYSLKMKTNLLNKRKNKAFDKTNGKFFFGWGYLNRQMHD